MKKTKILLYDLEISPTLAWVYDMYETNVLKVERYTHIMSLSWKWLGEKKIHNINLYDNYPRFMVDNSDDSDIVRILHKLLDEADVIIAHNGNKFDNKVSNTRFLKLGLTPPSPYKSVDTLLIARSKFKFGKNSLGDLGEFLDCGGKTEITHGQLWYDCLMKPTKKLWKMMADYNNNDVILLEKIYYKLLPYATNLPNVSNISQDTASCPRCGGSHLQCQGTRTTTTGTYQRYKCVDCGGWCAERISDKTYEHPTYVSYN